MALPAYQQRPRGRRALDPQCEPEDRRVMIPAWACLGCNVWWHKSAGDSCPQCEFTTQDLREMKLLRDIEVPFDSDTDGRLP